MTCLKSTLPTLASAPDMRTLVRPLTAQTLLEIEHAVIGALATLGREMFGAGLGMAPEPSLSHGVSRPDAGETEYASWMPDAGAVEFASWAKHLRSSSAAAH